MAILCSVKNLEKSFGAQHLFQGLSFGIFEGEKLGLIGANGTGKSTLLKILMGHEDSDDGEVTFKSGLSRSYVAQQDQFDESLDVEHAILKSLEKSGMDAVERHVKTQMVLGLSGFSDLKQSVATLSGGWRKRLAIASAVVLEPEILFLDEPTNHLDIEGVLWLENLLKRARFAFVVITHDRYFLENVTNRIMELGKRYEQGVFRVEGNYSVFLERRTNYLLEKEKQEEILSNKVRREVEWLRRGPKARTTKAKSRIEDALDLQSEFKELKSRNRSEQKAGFDFEAAEEKGKVLIKAHQICKSLGGKMLINKLSLKLCQGMKLGLMGKNGSGKSTLMNLLAGSLKLDAGTLKYGDNVRVVRFDQHRRDLDPAESLHSALSPTGGDTVIYRDKPVHIITWAKRFLFQPDQLKSRVGSLSGGEQARVMIARLMLQPADVLLLDEPTNDLDIPSLEVLEDTLRDFPGAIILVTHDRYLLDRVATQILHLDGCGETALYADVSQCLADKNNADSIEKKSSPSDVSTPKAKGTPSSPLKKLTYRDQFEFDQIEANILKAETALHDLKAKLEDPEMQTQSQKLTEICGQIATAQASVDTLYARWEELEKKRGESV